MTSIKTKFRPSSVEGKEGSIYFQIIHNRVVRQLNTAYRIFASEWDEEAETIIANGDRINIINAIRNGGMRYCTTGEKVRWLLTWALCPVILLLFLLGILSVYCFHSHYGWQMVLLVLDFIQCRIFSPDHRT